MGKKIRDSKWLYMVLSLFLAIVLWRYVTNDLNPTQTDTLTNVPVVFNGLDSLEERGMMVSEGLEQTVTLRIQARRNVIQQLNNENVSVVIAVSTITTTGEKSVTDYNVTFPRAVANDPITIRSRSPSTISFTISNWVEREIEVRGSFTGSVADGYQMGDLTVSPSTITIQGQEELVNLVDYALVTLSQENLSETYTGELPYTLIGFNGETLSMEKLNLETSSSAVVVTLPVMQLKEVELAVDVIPGGGATEQDVSITIDPPTIMVSGDEDALTGLDKITIGEVDLQQIFGTDTFTFPINLSEELTNVSGVSEATVTVSIEDLATRTLEVDNISVLTPDGYTADLVTQSRLVMIRGSEEAVAQVIPSQIRIVADLSEMSLATGTQTVPVRVYLDGASDVGVVGTDYKITVTISRG